MLVNWKALSELELQPASPISCSAIDQSWEEILADVLGQLELAWIAVDGGTIEITSLADAERSERIEFLRISPAVREQFAGDAALITSLREQLRNRYGDHTIELAIVGDFMIARANADAQRFLTSRLVDH
jgi:hypothetical protein